MKKFLSVFLCLTMAIGAMAALAACSPKETDKIVRVLNLGDYIADGSEGLMDVMEEFKARTGIDYTYDTVVNNEAMYTKLKGGGTKYDVIITSDYMLQRLIAEKMLQKLDYNQITNWGNIDAKYKSPYFDPKQEYTVPYNVGMVAVAYDSAALSRKGIEAPTSWNALWDERYTENGKGKVMMFGNPRDSFAIAQTLLGISFNTTDESEWRAAAQKIKDQKSVRYGFGDDEITDKLISGEVWIAPYYAGDLLNAREQNPDLRIYYPEEGVNIFIDSFAVLSDADNVGAAHKFIDFMLEPDVALENAEFLCYASPNTTVVNNPEYTWYKNEILYPTEDKMPKTETFENLPTETLELMSALWDEVKR
jgi:spermidine/putrescine transport system substrate-binding protein